ncbi:MAG: protein kinase [Deltaproteobacteria bacterium]|nr:protein kinase [Deltaproteobacteria bacterium]
MMLGSEIPAPTADPLLGQVISGAYRINTLLGSGGMGRVYRGEQLSLAKTVAVKVIHPHLLGDQASVARFYTEVRAASRLNHPNSVAVIDFGRTEAGLLYLVMEFLRGRDLGRLMYDEGPLPLDRVVQITRQILAALAEAHDNGVIHRDLKPENVLVERMRMGGDFVKVVDFGLAKMLDLPQSSVTRPGIVCGTPDYMAPEQGGGEETDARSDLYSVGVVLFQMLTDKLPYDGETATKIVLAHMTAPIPDPAQVAPQRGIPAALSRITMRALAKSPSERFQTALEFANALRDAWGGRTSSHPPPVTNKLTGAAIICPSCGAANNPNARFCNDCGARVTGVRPRASMVPASRSGPRPPELSEKVTRPGATLLEPPLVGRDAELTRLEELRAAASETAAIGLLIGEVGVGKTRMLVEVADRAQAGGDVVAETGPHPSTAPVAYHAIRMLVGRLLDIDPLTSAARWIDALDITERPSRLVRAGLTELYEGGGLVGVDPDARISASTLALLWALDRARMRGTSGRVVLLVDDLGRCDAPSRAVVRELVKRLAVEPHPVLLLVSSADPNDELGDDVVTVRLKGLPLELAAHMSDPRVSSDVAPAIADERDFTPMLVVQLTLLGTDAEITLSPRLADVVAVRIERLPAGARRVLQAAAIIGQVAEIEGIRTLLGKDVDVAAELRLLEDLGFTMVEAGSVEITHPLIRDVAEASTPAALRRELHSRCLDWLATIDGTPLEVRGHHAHLGDDPFGALLLLERCGDAAVRRGNAVDAVAWLRRGLELARAEALRGEMESAERAMVVFSRKLGEAMLAAGDVAGAEGVLREALDVAPRGGADRLRILALLARTSVTRARLVEANRFLEEALRGTEVVDRTAMADLWAEVATVWAAEGKQTEAIDALKRAATMLDGTPDRRTTRIRVLLRQAGMHDDLGDLDEALRALALAEDAATLGAATALLAAVHGSRGALLLRAGNREGAADAYKKAARFAEEAGDPGSCERYRVAAESADQEPKP